MHENIYNTFKDELGYTCVTNQYIELSVRKFQTDYACESEIGLQELAKTVGLTISELTDDYKTRICKGYIVSINSVLERFLTAFMELPGSPTNLGKDKRKSDESLLMWTERISNTSSDKELENNYYLCNYYHLIRNEIVHNGTEHTNLKAAYYEAFKRKDDRLNAPNKLVDLTFDDQVLFSRAAQRFARDLFRNSYYNITTILCKNKDEIMRLIKPFQETESRKIAARKLENYIRIRYPINHSINWMEEIDRLLEC